MLRLFDKDARQEMRAHRASVASLVGANLVPLAGVVFLGWSTFIVVLLYWLENIVIGVINVLKMITCSPNVEGLDLSWMVPGDDNADAKIQLQQARSLAAKPLVHHAAKLFFVPFFAFHYGFFCFGHGVFIVGLLGAADGRVGGGFGDLGGAVRRELASPDVFVAVLFLAASHLISFFVNYLRRGEYRRTVLPILMFQPYARIVVLHVAIIFGAMATMALGSPVWLLVILIAGKTVVDLGLHLNERRRNESPEVDRGVMTTA